MIPIIVFELIEKMQMFARDSDSSKAVSIESKFNGLCLLDSCFKASMKDSKMVSILGDVFKSQVSQGVGMTWNMNSTSSAFIGNFFSDF